MIITEDNIKTIIDNIVFRGSNTKICILYNNKPLTISTPLIQLPFGIDKIGNDYYFKFSLKNIKNTPELITFFKFIVNLENKIKNIYNINDNLFCSQYKINNGFDPLISIKIPQTKGQFNCIFNDTNKKPYNIFNIEKGTKAYVNILIDSLWRSNEKYSYKIKAKELTICV